MRMRLDSMKMDGFIFVHETNKPKTPFPSPEPFAVDNALFRAEREPQRVNGWNRLYSCQNKFTIDISDSEDSFIEDFDLEQTAEVIQDTMKENLKPGQDVELSVVDLVKFMKKEPVDLVVNACDAEYKPLPTYYFSSNHRKLKTIPDAGAATNKILRDRVTELIR